jgi:hypothetical protein
MKKKKKENSISIRPDVVKLKTIYPYFGFFGKSNVAKADRVCKLSWLQDLKKYLRTLIGQ